MTIQLSQKERMILQDQQSHEQLCIQKYQKYANQVQDAQLKQLFTNYAQAEQQHLNTINQLLNGQMPDVGQQGGQQQGGQQPQQSNTVQPAATSATADQSAPVSQTDSALLSDMLMSEKYVSGAYDTAIFEFADPNIRQVLNHIQKEEQQHGEGLFQYMQSHGMYNVQ